MSRLSRVAAGVIAAVGCFFAVSAFAADPPHGAGGMPPRGFHAAPPSFHGSLPLGGRAPGTPRYSLGGPGRDLGAFNQHGFSRFTPGERNLWEHGAWRHENHNGYLGWWWVVGDNWFFYPGPIFPYPLYVGPDYYYDYYNYYPSPENYWYYCEDPPGYYPNVQECSGPWEPVPPAY